MSQLALSTSFEYHTYEWYLVITNISIISVWLTESDVYHRLCMSKSYVYRRQKDGSQAERVNIAFARVII